MSISDLSQIFQRYPPLPARQAGAHPGIDPADLGRGQRRRGEVGGRRQVLHAPWPPRGRRGQPLDHRRGTSPGFQGQQSSLVSQPTF